MIPLECLNPAIPEAGIFLNVPVAQINIPVSLLR